MKNILVIGASSYIAKAIASKIKDTHPDSFILATTHLKKNFDDFGYYDELVVLDLLSDQS